MPDTGQHLHHLERQIAELGAALDRLGRDAGLQELQRIVTGPGRATAAELTFISAMLDSMRVQVLALERLNRQLLTGARRVGTDPMDFDLDIDDTLVDRMVPRHGDVQPNQGNVQVT